MWGAHQTTRDPRRRIPDRPAQSGKWFLPFTGPSMADSRSGNIALKPINNMSIYYEQAAVSARHRERGGKQVVNPEPARRWTRAASAVSTSTAERRNERRFSATDTALSRARRYRRLTCSFRSEENRGVQVNDGIAQVRLDDGTVVWARVGRPAKLSGDDPGGEQDRTGGGPPGGQERGAYLDSGFGSRIADLTGGLADTVRGVVRSVQMGLASAAPQSVTVEFGIDLSVKSGQVISLISDGSGQASVKVTLSWTEQSTPPQSPQSPSQPSAAPEPAVP